MADHTHVIPFIKKAEGGLSNNKADSASSNPVPDGSGYHTNEGITWTAFSNVYGTGADSIARFYTMNDSDWGTIFKSLYWDKILGDQITSQRIADIIVDWVWGSGTYYPEANIQDILIHTFNQHIAEDGVFGNQTVASLNAADEPTEWSAIVAKRFWYLDAITAAHPTNQQFLQGWKNRMNNLIYFENQ